MDGNVSYSITRAVTISNLTVRVCPIPASTVINVESATSMSVELYSSGGQYLRVPRKASGNKVVIDISHLPDGVYFMRIQFANFSEMRTLVIERMGER
jgi:Secretion system C-terminal sorting domain